MQEELKSMPIGISDFEEMIDSNYYYVDKSMLIKDIVDKRGKVTLITRPRRFGKTLNMSMLKYYFEKTNEDNSYLFKDLKIMQAGEKYTSLQGKYPVIDLTFKDAKMNSWEETYEKLKGIIADEYKRHDYLLESDIWNAKLDDYDVFKDVCNRRAKPTTYTSSIKNLCRYLELYYKQKPVVLIDEYDVPLQNSHLNGFYDDAINFIRAVLQSTLKDNVFMEFAIMTGCLRVSKESIFTGLNNLEMVTILNKTFSEHFGFLQSEVDEMLEYYGITDKRETIKEWYDGYKFGANNIYNPWSVTKSVKGILEDDEWQPQPYWTNTSGNDIVRDLAKEADTGARESLENLMSGGMIERMLDENVTYGELEEGKEKKRSINDIWNMLFFTGYLTYTEKRWEANRYYYTLKIPNEELRCIYEDIISSWFDETVRSRDLGPLFRSLVKGDAETLTDEINKILLTSISVYDNMETFYHGLLLGILQTLRGYQVKSNTETGFGRSDIMLIPAAKKNPAVIIEIKRVVAGGPRNLKLLCNKALEQIEDKKYDQELIDKGCEDILKYGIAFDGKDCMVVKK